MDAKDIEEVLASLPRVSVAVVGDLGVDRYWTVDPDLSDLSRETGLPIQHVVSAQARPGGAGTVVSQVLALGVGRVVPVAILGDDADALFLREYFSRLGISAHFILSRPGRPTMSYNRVLTLHRLIETQRLDVSPRSPLPREDEDALIGFIEEVTSMCEATIISDYTESARFGIITPRVCEAVSEIGRRNPHRPIIADSRIQAGRFHHVHLKMNEAEFRALTGAVENEPEEIGRRACDLARWDGRFVIVTLGARGLVVCTSNHFTHIPGFTVEGETDIVGAGDAVLAAVAASLAVGADHVTAGLLGVLVSSITVQQVHTTGSATPAQVSQRWREYRDRFGALRDET